MFDYAIGHWFQKAAEHVLGSVLCCPGCFRYPKTIALMFALTPVFSCHTYVTFI